MRLEFEFTYELVPKKLFIELNQISERWSTCIICNKSKQSFKQIETRKKKL